jgi:hypothetical protein
LLAAGERRKKDDGVVDAVEDRLGDHYHRRGDDRILDGQLGH